MPVPGLWQGFQSTRQPRPAYARPQGLRPPSVVDGCTAAQGVSDISYVSFLFLRKAEIGAS